jgi:hypothetical protein
MNNEELKQLTAQAVLEETILSALDGATLAKEAGQLVLFSAYHDVLRAAYRHASIAGLEFMDKNLRDFDPESLLDN